MDIDKLELLVCMELKGKGSSHDFSHIKRVLSIARDIADKSGNVNTRQLTAMCLLHDVIRVDGDDGEHTVAMSAERSVVLLRECGFEEEDIRAVVDGISNHSARSRDCASEGRLAESYTMEERILFDADKIDALGPIGVARWFLSISKHNWDLEKGAKAYIRIIDDFKKIKGGLYTPHGAALAKKRMDYSLRYMQDLLKSLEKG